MLSPVSPLLTAGTGLLQCQVLSGALLMWDPTALSLPHQLLKLLPGVSSLENSWQEQ